MRYEAVRKVYRFLQSLPLICMQTHDRRMPCVEGSGASAFLLKRRASVYHSKSCGRPVCVALLLFHSVSQAQINFRVSTVATPGDSVPVPSELVFATQPSVNDSGQVAFYADGAVLRQSNGQTTIVAAFGDPAPGGGTFIDAGGALINASGQIVFSANVTAPGRPGIFLWSDGSTQLIVRDGDPAPGGGTFTLSYEYSLNELGEIAFGAFTPSGEEMMLFLFSQGTVSLLARTGDPAPRGGAFLHLYHPVINANRQVAFESDLDSSEFGIFLRDADGSMIAVVRDGDPAPGGGGPLYPNSGEINDAGAVAFSAYSSIFGDWGNLSVLQWSNYASGSRAGSGPGRRSPWYSLRPLLQFSGSNRLYGSGG